MKKIFLDDVKTGLTVGLLSALYNYGIFALFHFYPDADYLPEFLNFGYYSVLFWIFLKGFLVGYVLMFLFEKGYLNILNDDTTSSWKQIKAIMLFSLYGIVAFLAFGVGDYLLMGSQEGMLVLLTVDGVLETVIATIPIRVFFKNSLRT